MGERLLERAKGIPGGVLGESTWDSGLGKGMPRWEQALTGAEGSGRLTPWLPDVRHGGHQSVMASCVLFSKVEMTQFMIITRSARISR